MLLNSIKLELRNKIKLQEVSNKDKNSRTSVFFGGIVIIRAGRGGTQRSTSPVNVNCNILSMAWLTHHTNDKSFTPQNLTTIVMP